MCSKQISYCVWFIVNWRALQLLLVETLRCKHSQSPSRYQSTRLCIHLVLVSCSVSLQYWLFDIFVHQRDMVDRVEASVVLSGKNISVISLYKGLSSDLPSRIFNALVSLKAWWRTFRNQWWHLHVWGIQWCWMEFWNLLSQFALFSSWWVPVTAAWITMRAAEPWLHWWPIG